MPELNIDELQRIARTLSQHSSLELARALHQALDRLEQAERERDELRAAAATEKRLQAQLIGVMGEQFKGYAAEADRNIADLRAALRQAEAERDALKADREAST